MTPTPQPPPICAICGGMTKDGTTHWSEDFGDGVVFVRQVPATICTKCGERWILDDVLRRLEAIASTAKHEHKLVEVVSY